MKKTTLALSISSALSLVTALPSAAANTNETAQAIEKIIVTANRIEQSHFNALTSITVITRDEIALSSVDSVADLLRTSNGIQLSHNGGAGQATSLFTRGTNSGHTLVIIDGQRISSATLGSVEFANLSLDQIERIEIIKGPRAALWGSDAIGGVIQIFTRQLDAKELNFTLGVGNEQQQQASLSTAIAHGDGATTFTLATQSSEGYDVLESAENDKDGYNRENFSLNGYQTLNEQWRISWLAKYNQGTSEYDNAWGGANKNAFDSYQWQLTANQTQGKLSQKFVIGQQQNSSIDYGNNIAKVDGSFFETKRLQAFWLGNYQINTNLNAGFGFDLIDEEVSAQTAYEITQRDLSAAFVRLAYDNNFLLVDGALRYDDIEGIDSETTYNFSTGLRFTKNSIVSLNLGTGFKAPSFNDLYYPTSAYSYGNPNLQAETSNTIELLLKTQLSKITLEASAYSTIIDNLIEWLPDENYAYHPINVNKATIKGVELTLSAQLAGVDHQLQLAYLNAKDDETNQALIRRAKQTAHYQMAYHWQQLALQAGLYYQGEREDIQWPSTITLPSYTLVNLSAHYQINSTWKVGLKVNNLFDRKYQPANNYVGQPAQYLITLSYQL